MILESTVWLHTNIYSLLQNLNEIVEILCVREAGTNLVIRSVPQEILLCYAESIFILYANKLASCIEAVQLHSCKQLKLIYKTIYSYHPFWYPVEILLDSWILY